MWIETPTVSVISSSSVPYPYSKSTKILSLSSSVTLATLNKFDSSSYTLSPSSTWIFRFFRVSLIRATVYATPSFKIMSSFRMTETMGSFLWRWSSALMFSTSPFSVSYYSPLLLTWPPEVAAVIFCCFCASCSFLLCSRTTSSFFCLNENSSLISLWVQTWPLTHGWAAIYSIFGL